MLGSTAGAVFWMFRYLERSENMARLVDAGQRIALTRSSDQSAQWSSIITTAGSRDAFLARHDDFAGPAVVDFLLRDRSNPSSVLAVVEQARSNAKRARTALTREVWESTNDCWLRLSEALAEPIVPRDLPRLLGLIRDEGALVRGALIGTMLRNDIYDFARLGTFIERADNTSRILDVKYYVLLPSPRHVGSRLDTAQWDTILRSLSAQRSFHWQSGGRVDAASITEFLILDRRLPRSLAFCFAKIVSNLGYLAATYGDRRQSHELADGLVGRLSGITVRQIFDFGLHEFLAGCVADTNNLARQIEIDYRFTR